MRKYLALFFIFLFTVTFVTLSAVAVLADDDDDDDDEKNSPSSPSTTTDTDVQTSISTQILPDSDGDGILDSEDPHPNTPEIYIVKDDNQNGIVDSFENANNDGNNINDSNVISENEEDYEDD